jgi:hypothetical protein
MLVEERASGQGLSGSAAAVDNHPGKYVEVT